MLGVFAAAGARPRGAQGVAAGGPPRRAGAGPAKPFEAGDGRAVRETDGVRVRWTGRDARRVEIVPPAPGPEVIALDRDGAGFTGWVPMPEDAVLVVLVTGADGRTAWSELPVGDAG
ncbi:hypothetical protein ACFXAQ_03260 [Streptomyces olivaceus]|uniref:hypothetical protein n=1 Tax=Streptomyces olivaceus TaxID=47716 RepID=UPI00367BA7AD